VAAIVAGVAANYLLGLVLPGFAFPAVFCFLAILAISVTWGVGPSLLATVLGSVLLHVPAISSRLDPVERDASEAVAFGVFLTAGTIISLVASQAEARRQQVAAAEEERSRLLAAERRARAETELALRRLQQILDVLPEGILIAGVEPPTVMAANQAAQQFLGLDVVGQPVPIPPPGTHGEFAARHLDGTPYPIEELPLERALLRGEVVRGVRFVIRNAASGRETAILANSAPLHDATGTVDGAVEVFQDITAIRDLERQREEFVATVSHDLKNPLTNILGMGELLQRRAGQLVEPDRARFGEGIGTIVDTARRMAAQIDEMVDITRAQMGRSLHLQLTPTDVAVLLASVVDEYQRTTERHTLRLQRAEDRVVGMTDEVRLRRAVSNLLTNAIKYSPQGGDVLTTLTLSEEQGGEWLIISVADEGVGIPSGDLPHVLEGFYRAGNVAGWFTGSGLGLAGVRQVIEQHGGAIAIESTQDIGTTVTIRLPLLRPPLEGR
jgi:signal transduction histidine kinase